MTSGADRPSGLVAVVPVFDEAERLGAVVEGLRHFCPVIVVDDGSADGSGRRALEAGAACVLRHARRRGKGAALRTGFAEALRRRAQQVATLDGDGQHDPADLPRLLAATGGAPDVLVVGDRFGSVAGDRVPPTRRAAMRVADAMLRRLTRSALRDTQCGYRIYPGALLRALVLREERFALEAEALVRAADAGFRLVGAPVRRIYLPGRVSRFRACPDSARIAWLLAREVAAVAGRRLAGHLLGRRAPLPVRAGER